MLGLLLAIGGAAGTDVLTPLIQPNITSDSHISSNNPSTLHNATVNTVSSNNSSINQSNSSISEQNMTEIIDSQKMISYGDIHSETQDIIV